ncbi:hypothetical protein [Staphylococcus intermedius]|uniref:Putative transmembrane protein n=1 Tax=Staphylococcus intermedius NCTC 11048 TaxID=1141106 RepID=A0A380G7L1_STAIN|nr:hypothetical protein [Staphylococcus intermedius]PCF63740.1 hypothetical protein B5C04_07105 [Staphylococcus intermedius]PCF78455.1 hypothetical protein B4W74_07455 [Staphylococcus intermedius]PCF79429.1 hypothetical protein B4W70_07095 [Staphylococcus intermedius]PCF86835.1 hypothetical protein B4W76_07210 [Staphylococcus intermedius]PCF89915.1 hypothetical protein B4W75_03455 [Staphylococcus intermedius]
MILLWFGIHRYINHDQQQLKSPSVISWVISLLLYFVAIVLYQTDALHLYERIHEIALVTVFGFIVAWTYSHLYRSIDTVVYTVMIVLFTLVIFATSSPNLLVFGDITMMLLVRLILTTAFVGIGVHVVIIQLKAKNMENFPLLYFFAFGYWITIAYWI